MNRWKGSISWALVWSLLILVGGSILYSRYISTLSNSFMVRTEERTETQTDKIDQAVYVHAAEDCKSQNPATKQEDVGVKTLSEKEFPSPVKGKLLRSVGKYYSEVYGMDLFHAGYDYVEPEGTVIRATHEGNVIFAGPDSMLGQKVTLDCGEGWLVTYGGLDNLRVKVGEKVETQGALGQVGFFPGAEGENGQPQFHYEIRHGNEVQRLY